MDPETQTAEPRQQQKEGGQIGMPEGDDDTVPLTQPLQPEEAEGPTQRDGKDEGARAEE